MSYSAYREETRRMVAAIRAEMVCSRCGSQPIDWHREEHEEHPEWRVARLIESRTRERVLEEIPLCTPLCRSCHMAEDGRAAALTANRPFKKGDRQPPKPCVACGVLSNPRWREMCRKCYDRRRWQRITAEAREAGRAG